MRPTSPTASEGTTVAAQDLILPPGIAAERQRQELEEISRLLDGCSRSNEPLLPQAQVELFGLLPATRGPACHFAGLPVYVTHALGDMVTRTKRWKRRGRLPKVKTRVVGRMPAFYMMLDRVIITNPEGLKLLKKEVFNG